ncbi:MAG TPA: ABC transporter substrate-binding protein [Acidimicrobiales bacterium]|nr:ABC transporter substrate-binding protein [Acidimicrobiales bacterium]
MHFLSRIRLPIAFAVAFGALVLILGVPTTSQAAAASTITFAEMPGASPNYIFPYASCLYDSPNNIGQFQQLMYRPLYWFGVGPSVAESAALSLASPPTYNKSDTSVTVTMKGWRFADGQIVDAQSVKFFLNMYVSDPLAFCGYEQGMGVPDQVRSVTASGNTVRINFTRAVNPTWMTDDFLSQITPMPTRWDRVSPSQSGRCSTGVYGAGSTIASCKSVETYLSGLATKTKTFSGAFWQGGVDGPWKLATLDGAGNVTFEANPAYSGPQKARVKYVREVSFTSADLEVAALDKGALDVGYIDPSTLPPRSSPRSAGPNLAALSAKYNLAAGSSWGFNEAVFNFNPANAKSAAIAELYIRQALQEAVNQSSIVSSALNGYGYSVDSPLPLATPTSVARAITNPYPYNPVNAKALLTSHGWTEVSGVMTCISAGTAASQCGANINAGYTLNFNIVWPGDSPTLNAAYKQEIASWAQIGVVVTPNYDTANNVVTDCSPTSIYQICVLETGWNYASSYFPSGEELFTPKGTANFGAYSDTRMTSLIDTTTSRAAGLTSYASYAAQQLPVLYEPQIEQTIEVLRTLKSSVGFVPNPLGNFMPEYYYF